MRATTIITIALLALAGCEKSGTRKEPEPTPVPQPPGPEQPPPGARVVLLGPAESGEPRLFQWVPGHEPQAIELAGGAPIVSAATSPSSSAMAFTVRGASGADRVWSVTSAAPDAAAELAVTLEAGATSVVGVSDDGRVVALEVGADLVVASVSAAGEASLRTMPVTTLGKRVYGASLAADGSKLAFSVMDLACSSDLTAMARCPVRLYGVDLSADELSATAITPAATPGATSVSYDPQLLGAHGDEVLYMTTTRDDSPACRTHVNQCRYALERRPFGGGDSTLVEDDAVLGRVAPDGTLSYRRLDRSSGTQTWSGQSLLVGGAPAARTVVNRSLENRYHFWSSDSQRIAVQQRFPDHLELRVVDRKGESVAGPAGTSVRAVGWFAQPLPTSAAALALPPEVRGLQRAVALAKQVAPNAVAMSGAPAYAVGQLDAAPAELADGALEPWLAKPGPRAAVLQQSRYCDIRERLRASGVAIGAAHSVEPGLVVAAVPAPSSTLDPPSVAIDPATQAVARFDGRAAGGGVVELVRASFPPSAKRGERIRGSLVWRIVEPPSASWRVFVHIDGTAQRVGGDHTVAVCGPQASWAPGTLVADDFDIEMGNDFTGVAPGKYIVFVGWFSGANRAVATGSAEAIDDRVPLSSIQLLP